MTAQKNDLLVTCTLDTAYVYATARELSMTTLHRTEKRKTVDLHSFESRQSEGKEKCVRSGLRRLNS